MWIPCLFQQDKQERGTGWVRSSTKEMIIIEGSLANTMDQIEVTSLRTLFGLKIGGLVKKVSLYN